MTAKPILHIRLFGSLSATALNGKPIQIPPSRVGALLALLAIECSNPRPCLREEIVDLLWPEDEADEARHKLSQTLYDLRRQISQLGLQPESILKSTRSTLQLSPEQVSVDAMQFEAGLAAAGRISDATKRAETLESTLELYRGELLPGFYLEKLIAEKTRLDEAYHTALKALALAYEEIEQYDSGIDAARKLLALNPLNEEAHFTLMRLYAATGQPSSVVKQYHVLERGLKDDLGEEPSDSAQQLVKSLRERATARAAESGIKPTPGRGGAGNGEGAPQAVVTFDRPSVEANDAAHQPLRVPAKPQIASPIKRGIAYIALPVSALALMLLLAGPASRKHTARTSSAPSVTKPQSVEGSHAGVLVRYALAADERGSEPTALATDNAGNLYVAGFVETTHNDADFITIKYDANGHELWRRRYNGTGNDVDRLRCIAVDTGGNVYVSGESDNGKGNGSTRLAGLDVVTIKYSPDGKELWQDRYDDIDHGEDRPVKMLLDSKGNAYVLSSCRRLRNGKDAGCDFVLIKYSPDGERLWLKRYDGEAHSDDNPTGMALFYGDSGVCVCGSSRAAYRSGAEYDFVTIKYSADGKCLWTRRYGANGHADSYARDVAAMYDGGAYVVGEGRGLPGTPDESKTGCIMVKYSPSGEMLWARGTVNESDRLEHVTASAFWIDGYAAFAGPTGDEPGEPGYRVVLRDADGGFARTYTIPARYYPTYSAPKAMVIWPEDKVTHDGVWMVGSRGTNSIPPLEFVVANLSHHDGMGWTSGYGPANEYNAAGAAVLCRLKGPVKIVVAGQCGDKNGVRDITLVQYSE